MAALRALEHLQEGPQGCVQEDATDKHAAQEIDELVVAAQAGQVAGAAGETMGALASSLESRNRQEGQPVALAAGAVASAAGGKMAMPVAEELWVALAVAATLAEEYVLPKNHLAGFPQKAVLCGKVALYVAA